MYYHLTRHVGTKVCLKQKLDNELFVEFVGARVLVLAYRHELSVWTLSFY